MSTDHDILIRIETKLEPLITIVDRHDKEIKFLYSMFWVAVGAGSLMEFFLRVVIK